MRTTFDISITNHAECTVIVVAGELDISTSPHITEAASPVLLNGRTLSLDLSGVPFMDSSGLNALLSLRQRAQHENGNLELRGLNRQALRLLDITGARSLFQLS
ncbi:STAS domain-containing protein [Streptomyces sp. NPDC059650]|uniref:STAS domain-containing protein n=1 Tax=Streptomyces sp. NPDC059650 TaxID=3346896 RepID=UPI0036A116A3